MSKVAQVATRFLVAFGLYAAAVRFGWIEGPLLLGAIIALLVSLLVVLVMPDRPRRWRS